MDTIQVAQKLNRRHFLDRSRLGLGALALGSLAGQSLGKSGVPGEKAAPGERLAHFAGKAKRVIYLFQSGAPSQFETFDYKPKLAELRGEELPASVRMGQRLTTMT